MIVGHRGGKERPENTLSAFKHGLELGLQGFEFDIQLTLDGQLVVFHDETLDRTTNAHGKLKEKTLIHYFSCFCTGRLLACRKSTGLKR